METKAKRQRPLNQDPAAVRRHRLIKCLEQAELAARAGISNSHMSKIENGKGSAGVKVLRALADALGCSIEDLVAKAPHPAARARG